MQNLKTNNKIHYLVKKKTECELSEVHPSSANALLYFLIQEVKANSEWTDQGRFTELNSYFDLPLFDRAGLGDNQSSMIPNNFILIFFKFRFSLLYISKLYILLMHIKRKCNVIVLINKFTKKGQKKKA